MLRYTIVLLVPIAVLSLACHAADSPPPGASEPTAGPAPPTADAALWREAGLAAQPRLDALRRGAAGPGYEPGSTSWRTTRLDLPAELRTPDAATDQTPGALLAAVVAHLGLAHPLGTELWELTSRVWMDGDTAAVGLVLAWGMKDDSVAGRDLRVRIERGERGWYAAGFEERFHCARGVTEEGLCV